MYRPKFGYGISTIGTSLIFERVIVFFFSIILARLLIPEDFGIIAMAMTVTEAVGLFGNLGLGNALIYQQDQREQFSNAAFWSGFVISIFLFVIQIALSGFASIYYKAPELKPVLFVLAFSYPLSALGNIHSSIMLKDIKFREVGVTNFLSALLGNLIAIVIAMIYRNYWAIIIGRLITITSSTILSWIISGWHPTGFAKLSHYRNLFSYGKNLLFSDGLSYINHNIDYLLLGKEKGPQILGTYSFAYNLAMIPVTTVSTIIGKVSFPIYTELQSQKDELQKAYLFATRISALIGFPFLFGLIVLAGPLIVTIFGEQWQASVIPVQLLAIYSIGRCVNGYAGVVLNAVGKPYIPLRFNIIYTPIMVLAIILSVPYGANRVAMAVAIVSGTATWLYTALMFRVMQWPFSIFVRTIKPALFVSIIMGIATLLFSLMTLSYLSQILGLIINILFGVFIYILLITRFDCEASNLLRLITYKYLQNIRLIKVSIRNLFN